MAQSGPRFSEAARIAAATKRRERSRLAALMFNEPSVFALRASPPDRGYVWEVRKFGGVSLARGARCYESAAEAREAGGRALAEGVTFEGEPSSAPSARFGAPEPRTGSAARP